MKKARILGLIALTLSIMTILPLVSSEIIWSNSVTIPFKTSGANTTIPLNFNIISPTATTYQSGFIDLEVQANKNVECWYSIDNEEYIYLGSGNHFFKYLSIERGNHVINVKCKDLTNTVIKEVKFSVVQKTHTSTTPETIKKHETLDNTTTYGQWKCVNHQMQRTNIINGIAKKEYGAVCGIPSNSNSNTKINKTSLFSENLILFPLVIFIFILITLVLIAMVLVKGN